MIEIGSFKLDSDFDYRIIREEDNDVDLYIDINYRCVDINVGQSEIFNFGAERHLQLSFTR